MQQPSSANDYQSRHAWVLLDSYRHFVGSPLIEEGSDQTEAARQLFQAPFVVVSHDAQPDPVLSYGNEAALRLWQTDWQSLTQMPSRLTAEPVHRDERAGLLQESKQKGFINNYRGVRISTTGRRFLIEGAVIWTLLGDSGNPIGQAATFETVTFL